MRNRRDFLKTAVGATAAVFLSKYGLIDAVQAARETTAKRRKVMVGGRRVTVVDIHAHCVIPDVADVVKDTPFALNARRTHGAQVLGPDRLQALDARGIDVQVLSINGFWWYAAARDFASKIVDLQTGKLAEWCKVHSDRFVGLTSVALQFPDLAAEQLEHAMKELGIRGAAIGGHVQGEPLSSPRFDPFWAKAQELGALVFMHPGGATSIVKEDALKGNGDLSNIVGDPLETTVFLSHLIFDGTLDRFPDLRICAAHAGGYLPSYIGRSEVACDVRPNAKCMNKKHPTEYFKQQIMADAMIFTDEGLRHLVAQLEPSQVVYGTDMPFNWPDNVDMILRAKYLSDADREAILGGSLVKLLKL